MVAGAVPVVIGELKGATVAAAAITAITIGLAPTVVLGEVLLLLPRLLAPPLGDIEGSEGKPPRELGGRGFRRGDAPPCVRKARPRGACGEAVTD